MKSRNFLSVFTILMVLILFITSCAPAAPAPTSAPEQQPAQAEPTKPPAEEPTATQPAIKAVEATPTAVPTVAAAKYKEAPDLADQVKAGKLPPVDERLPISPVVTTPVDKVGKYGGVLHTASWWPGVGNVLMYLSEPPIKWKADLSGYEPALAESYEWSKDGKTFTLHLRKGLKWSDGQPYTTADWKFWWEDMATNEEYKVVSVPGWLRKSDGTPVDMTFPDDFTVVWASDVPVWINPYFMAQGYWEFATPMMKPAHYLKQFHPKYDKSKTYQDLEKVDKFWDNKDFPCLFAWCSAGSNADGSRFSFVRNPYYWRVDTEGNQLPYIDSIDVDVVADEQVRILNCAQGKYDTAFRICGAPTDIPLMQENAKAGGYHLLKGWMNGVGGWPGYEINMSYQAGGKNYPDDTPEHAKEIRDLIRDKRFRKALSVGIDRVRMIDVVWNGIGEPQGATISPQSWHYYGAEGQRIYEEWKKTDSTFDADKANAWLDELGMKKGADGFRTLPSGKPFELVLDISSWGGSMKVQSDGASELKVQWEKYLGIKVRINNVEGQPDGDTRVRSGFYMLKAAHISQVDEYTFPAWVFPVNPGYLFSQEAEYYATGGKTGLKPEPGSPAEFLQNLYRKGIAEPDINKRHEVVWEGIRYIMEEGPFMLAVAGDQPMPIIVKDYMRNILEFGIVGPWAPDTPANQVPAQWWMDK